MRKFFNAYWNETALRPLFNWGGAFWETPMRLDKKTHVPVAYDLRQKEPCRELAAPASAIYTVHTDPQLRTSYTGTSGSKLPVPHRVSA